MKRRSAAAVIALSALVGLASHANGAEAVPLSDPGAEMLGWSFDNGREFPGATGGLTVEAVDGAKVLRLTGDFTRGGGYVQAGRRLQDVPIASLSLRLKDTVHDALKFRIVDAAGQCHQIVYQIGRSDEWRKVTFPLQGFFDRMGKPDAITGVTKYEYWGGPNDGKWHGPAKGLYFLLSPKGDQKRRTLLLGDVQAVAAPDQPAGGATAGKWLPVDEGADGQLEWGLSLGQEFPGAKGKLEAATDPDLPGKPCVRLAGDFTGGGAYIEAQRPLRGLDADDIRRVRFHIRTESARRIGFRLVDATGQTHQKRGGILVEAGGKWHEVALDVSEVAGSESWGGANDGKWHGPPQLLTIILPANAAPEDKKPVLLLADVQVEGVVPGQVELPAFREGFEAAAGLPQGWAAEGDATVVEGEAFAGKRALCLRRSEENVARPAEVTAPAFKVRGGSWELRGAFRADLVSPDNSYNATVWLECSDAAGRPLERFVLAELFRKANWRPVATQVSLRAAAATARLRIRLNKAHGRFWADDLSAAYVAVAPSRRKQVDRALFATQRLGNLLLPGDKPEVKLTLVALRPLGADRRTVRFVLRDYWGAEQIPFRTVELQAAGRTGDGEPTYTATLDLAGAPFETGRYYEVHVEAPQPGGEPFQDYTSLAYLPPAEAKKHPWRDVPFTCRNWDNRITEYFVLADRLGLRVCGIWSGWDATPPYATHAPGFDHIRKFDMGAVMGTPGNTVEYRHEGYERYDAKALSEGAARLVREHNGEGRLLVCLGNEPHGKGAKVLEDVAAYRAMYEGAKSADAKVPVLGTSVGPEEEYFAAGFGKYCDVYDFHTYDDVEGIRRTFRQYDALFEKYGHRRPIWSTELGLNSQGMTRLAVASDLVRKFATFFACGGQNASWFGILYPDPKGTAEGSAGQAHNVFFCRYNGYSPKLDAIAYYNMVNGICVKKSVAERQYDSIRAVLFRDAEGRCLQVLWNDGPARDVLVPLAGVADVRLVRIDGGIGQFHAGGVGLTFRIGAEPLLLLYDAPAGGLAEKLGPPSASLSAVPEAMIKGGSAEVAVRLADLKASDVSLQTPPGWTVALSASSGGDQGVRLRATAPRETAVREASLRVVLTREKRTVGELSFRPAVRGVLDTRLLPDADAEGTPRVRLVLHNNAPEPREVSWRLTLPKAVAMKDGEFNPANASAPDAHFAAPAEGTCGVPAGGEATVTVPLAGVDAQTVYTIRAMVTDPEGRATSVERLMGGFALVPRASGEITLDGRLDEKDWGRSRVLHLREARQMRHLSPNEPWTGPEDLSGRLRFLWDDRCLYVAMEVTDDALVQTKQDDLLWAQDGLQLLVDPCRASDNKTGKYDYSAGVGSKGPQAWCHLAPPGQPTGEAKDIIVRAKPTGEKGNITCEIAIPWTRLAPFRPEPGANLGLCVVLNEDDGKGRFGFLGWFGDVQSKQVDAVGDLILAK